MTQLTGVQIDTDGVLSVIQIDGTTIQTRLTGLYRAIGCELVDVVGVTNDGGVSLDLWVDDEGLYRQHPNPTLTGMARLSIPEQSHLSGSGVFLASTDEGDTIGLTREQIATVVTWWQIATANPYAGLLNH